MARPWEGKDFTEEELIAAWGPAQALDGDKSGAEKKPGTTREEFYDKMVANGWNRPGDDILIGNIWIYLNAQFTRKNEPDMEIITQVMNSSGKTAKERDELLDKVYTFDSGYMAKVSDDYRSIRVASSKASFERKMIENGYSCYENPAVYDILYRLSETQFEWQRNSALVINFNEVVEDDINKFSRNRQMLMELINLAKDQITDEEKELLTGEIGQLTEKHKEVYRIADYNNYLRITSNLREYLKLAIELDLDKIELDENYYPDDEWGLGIDIKEEPIPKELTDAVRNDIMNIRIDMSQGLEKATESVQQQLADIVNKHYSPEDAASINDSESLVGFLEVDYEDMAKDPEGFKKKLADSHFNHIDAEYLQIIRTENAQKKMLEADPDLETRREHIDDAYKSFLKPILQILKDPANAEFVKAVRENKDTESVELKLHDGSTFEDDDIADRNQRKNVLHKLAENNIKAAEDLYTRKDMMNDPFWKQYSEEGVTKEQVTALLNRFREIADKGLVWDEFVNTPSYTDVMEKCGFRRDSYFKPYEIVSDALKGEETEEELAESISLPRYNMIMSALDYVEAQYMEKGNAIMDMDTLELAGWFIANGYDMIQNTILVTNGFEEIKVEDKTYKVVNLSNDIDESKLDRDMLTWESYSKMVNNARKAQTIYRENEDDFKRLFSTMDALKNSNLGGDTLASMLKTANLQEETLKKLNDFRHCIYLTQIADKDVCKLIDLKNNNKVVQVEALSEDTEFNADTMGKERGILDICFDMLKDPTNRTKKDSSEYKNLMASVENLKKDMSKTYTDENEARKAYVKGVDKILKNISLYREHKARDGWKQDATTEKLIAVERVDKLLRTRYRNIEQMEYEDDISGLSELFDVEVDNNKMGDDYVYAKSIEKIRNMRKTFEQYKLEQEGEVKRSKTADEILADKNLFGDRVNTDANKENKPKDQELMAEEDHYYKSVMDKEAAYRAKQDPADDLGKENLVRSAEKLLYIGAIKNACESKASKEGVEEAKAVFGKKMEDLDHGRSLQYRAFKFEHLQDKTFNEEFRNRVLKGAQEGKTKAEDIYMFRDEALAACYNSKNRKNPADLDKISTVLGSNVNSQTIKGIEGVKNKVNYSALLKEEKKNAPKKEIKKEINKEVKKEVKKADPEKEEAPIKRSKTFEKK